MKKLYSYALAAALLLGGLRAAAQPRPTPGPGFRLGSSQTLMRELETQVQARAGQPTVSLRVGPHTAYLGRVNYRQDLAATGEYVVGELPNVPGGSFFLRIEGKAVAGNIVLRKERRAYRYSADAQGNATVREVDIDKVVCVDFDPAAGTPAPAANKAAAAPRAAAIVSLQSFPGAKGCVLLDFDGQYVAGTPWNSGNPINAAPSPLTNTEIQEFWEGVSEDYRPFSLNITTDESVFNSYPKNLRMRCIVTPTNTAAPGAGGVAYVTSFRGNDDTPCWVFQGGAKFGGDAASHEIGHTLGLSHDGRVNPSEEYYTASDNSGVWAPIMGAAYGKAVTQWSRGEYNRASQTQDDLAIMSGPDYNVGYRNDDHGNSTGSATALRRDGNALAGNGFIERTTDQDYFSFSTGGGTASFSVNTVSRFGNLDIVARLFDGGGQQIGSFDAPGGSQLSVSFSASLGAGTYYLQIDGTGSGNPATDGYSDYGSLGTYSISGTAPAGGGSPGQATVYFDCNYAGKAVNLPEGSYSLAQMRSLGVNDNDISSLRINPGYDVVLFTDDQLAGSRLTLIADNACLTGNALGGGTWNDQTTSLLVRRRAGVVSLYSDCNYGGKAIGLPTGSYSLAQMRNLGVSDNDISSLRINPGYDVVLFTDDQLAGTRLTLTGDNACLTGNALGGGTWNDQTTSLLVRSLPGQATVYSDCNYGGKAIDLPEGSYSLAQLGERGVGNDDISSLRVNPGYDVVLFTDDQLAGTRLTLTSDNACLTGNALGGGTWNDQTTSLLVRSLSSSAAAASSQPAAAAASPALASPVGLELFPNPVTDRLHVQLPAGTTGGSYQIMDALGRTAGSGTLRQPEAVDVSRLTPGMYTMLVQTLDHQQLVSRFSKQ